MQALLAEPDQFSALQANPDLVANATEEIIRWTSPVRHFMRYATEDSVVGGVEIPAGGRVLLSYPAANRDNAVFADAARFDIEREGADRHLGFGLGSHFCLGSQFARRELRTMVHKLSAELDHIEPDGDVEYAASHFVSGVKHLPITYAFR